MEEITLPRSWFAAQIPPRQILFCLRDARRPVAPGKAHEKDRVAMWPMLYLNMQSVLGKRHLPNFGGFYTTD